jgi:RimJ/RimL family protein N-acetyltransferase
VSRPHPPIAAPLGDAETSRLLLRRFHNEDLDELASVFSHPEVWIFPYGRAFDRAETQAFLDAQLEHWEECGFGCWTARPRADTRLIGYVGLSVPTFLPEILPAVEVGWRFTPSAWGHGYATEGAAVALDQAFTKLGLQQVCSLPQTDNPRSCLVAERLGMRRVGERVVAADDRRGAVTAAVYEIDAGEWLARRGSG